MVILYAAVVVIVDLDLYCSRHLETAGPAQCEASQCIQVIHAIDTHVT